MTQHTPESLAQMPMVTVEQINRFREVAVIIAFRLQETDALTAALTQQIQNEGVRNSQLAALNAQLVADFKMQIEGGQWNNLERVLRIATKAIAKAGVK